MKIRPWNVDVHVSIPHKMVGRHSPQFPLISDNPLGLLQWWWDAERRRRLYTIQSEMFAIYNVTYAMLEWQSCSSKMAAKRGLKLSLLLQARSSRSKLAQVGVKLCTSWPQVGLKFAQDGLMLASNGVKNRSIGSLYSSYSSWGSSGANDWWVVALLWFSN